MCKVFLWNFDKMKLQVTSQILIYFESMSYHELRQSPKDPPDNRQNPLSTLKRPSHPDHNSSMVTFHDHVSKGSKLTKPQISPRFQVQSYIYTPRPFIYTYPPTNNLKTKIHTSTTTSELQQSRCFPRTSRKPPARTSPKDQWIPT